MKLLTGLFLVAVPPAASAQTYVYGRATFPTGNEPFAVAVADINGDGIQDLVVANQGDSTVSVLLGQAGGKFAAKTDFATGVGPYGIVVGDFNGDGHVDIATVDDCGPNCGFVSILLGKGDGTFQAHVDYATDAEPLALITKDFNGDGKLDLAVVGSCGTQCGAVSVLLGNGDGTFQPKLDYPVAVGPDALVAADLNGDGKLDLAVTTSAQFVSVLLGNGDGTFQAHVDFPSAGSPSGIAVADFDGNNSPDLVVSHGDTGISILLGNGDGTFQSEQQIESQAGVGSIVAIDLNGDGKQDLVVGDAFQGGVIAMLGNADGTFRPPTNFAAGAAVQGLAVADVNGDGHVDIEATDSRSNSVNVLLGNGDGTFSPRVPPPGSAAVPAQYPYGAAIGDFNGDGIPDLALTYSTTTRLSVFPGVGDGTFSGPINTASTNGYSLITAADFNGDGKLDIAALTGSGAVILLGNGNGTFQSPLLAVNTSGGSVRGLVVGDFNHDGKPDLVVLGNGFVQTTPIYVLLGNGDGTFQPAKQFWSSATIPMAVAAGDFNGDGNLDLVVTVNPNGIAVMLGNGDGTFQSPVTYPTDELPEGVTVADLNGDGIPDIVATGLMVDLFLGNGDGSFPASPVLYSGGNSPGAIITGDFNGDGKTDIAVAAEGNAAVGGLELLIGNGDGTFQSPVEIADADAVGAGPMAVGDFNRDGVTDLVVIGYGVGSVFVSGPIATLSPASINFGSVGLAAAPPAQTLTLSNSGEGPLDLTNAVASASFGVTSDCGTSLAQQTSCSLSVTFTPSDAGSDTGLVTLSDSAPGGQQIIPLAGTGLADFTLALASGGSDSATVSPGSSANYSLSASPLGGFNQQASFACTGAPSEATCTVSPASQMFDGTDSVTLSVKVTTTAPSSAASFPRTFDSPRVFLFAMVLLSFFGVLLVTASRARPAAPRPHSLGVALMLCVFLVLLISASSCSSGSGSGGIKPPPDPGTPTGTYILTITGTSGSGPTALQHTMQLTLVVN